MENALLQVGLPVKCYKCSKKGFVKPATDYGGWYRSRFRDWFCPKHAQIGSDTDRRFYEKYKTPELEPDAQAELYKLLD